MSGDAGVRRLLQHMLAALAYRTQKALRAAPENFGEFPAGKGRDDPPAALEAGADSAAVAASQMIG